MVDYVVHGETGVFTTRGMDSVAPTPSPVFVGQNATVTINGVAPQAAARPIEPTEE